MEEKKKEQPIKIDRVITNTQQGILNIINQANLPASIVILILDNIKLIAERHLDLGEDNPGK